MAWFPNDLRMFSRVLTYAIFLYRLIVDAVRGNLFKDKDTQTALDLVAFNIQVRLFFAFSSGLNKNLSHFYCPSHYRHHAYYVVLVMFLRLCLTFFVCVF